MMGEGRVILPALLVDQDSEKRGHRSPFAVCPAPLLRRYGRDPR